MSYVDRHAARALLLSPQREVLLMCFQFPWREEEVWITPGGSLEGAEDHRQALVRELNEECGLIAPRLGVELWRREHRLSWKTHRLLQKERYFLVEVDRFEPNPCGLDPGDERDWFRRFRWWPIDEIPDHSDEFAPAALGRLARAVVANGPPSLPHDIDA